MPRYPHSPYDAADAAAVDEEEDDDREAPAASAPFSAPEPPDSPVLNYDTPAIFVFVGHDAPW